MFRRALNRDVVTRIGVTHHPGRRIVMQHAGNTRGRFVGTDTDDNHPGVLREAHPDATTVMQRHPGRAAGGME